MRNNTNQDMIPRTSNAKAQKIQSDFIDYKLFVAKSLLTKSNITVKSPKNNEDYKQLLLETNIETLLFFMGGVLDGLWNEIKEKTSLKIEFQNNTMIHTPRQELDVTQQQVWDQIADFFQMPLHTVMEISTQERIRILTSGNSTDSNTIHTVNTFVETMQLCKKYGILLESTKIKNYPCHIKFGWNFSKSYLWIIRKMRNHITHKELLNNLTYSGVHNMKTIFILVDDAKLIFPENIIEIQYPYDFFSKCITELEKLVIAIRKVL